MDSTGPTAPARTSRPKNVVPNITLPDGSQRRFDEPVSVAAIAASAVVGTMMWREVSTPSVPVVAMEPVIATAPVRPEARYVSPALLQAMATGNPVWPATVILEEAPNNFVNVDYSMSTMSSLDDRQ